MHKEHLYTVMVRVYQTQEVFIHQLRTTTTHPSDVLFAWVEQAVTRGFIKGTDDPKVPFRDITEHNTHMEALDRVFNVWRIIFNIGKDFYVKDVIRARNDGIFELNECISVTIDFIKTSTEVSAQLLTDQGTPGPTDARYVRHAEGKYASYLERYELLKGVSELTRSITQERRRVEKQLIYWDVKRRFYSQFYNRDVEKTARHRYTINFNYEYYHTSGVWTYQPHIVGADINYIFHDWARGLLYGTWRPDADSDDRERIITDQDRLLLMDKVSSGYYSPVPVEGCVNVWSTYFSLSAGMVKITMIKTALDEVVPG
jgi:hypothetical protein